MIKLNLNALLVLSLFFLVSPTLKANTFLPVDCNQIEEGLEKSKSIIPFLVESSVKDVVDVGRCVARSVIKKNKYVNWGSACSEIIEYETSIFGALSFSKSEAIKVGQCAELVLVLRQGGKQCLPGQAIVKRIIRDYSYEATYGELFDEICD